MFVTSPVREQVLTIVTSLFMGDPQLRLKSTEDCIALATETLTAHGLEPDRALQFCVEIICVPLRLIPMTFPPELFEDYQTRRNEYWDSLRDIRTPLEHGFRSFDKQTAMSIVDQLAEDIGLPTFENNKNERGHSFQFGTKEDVAGTDFRLVFRLYGRMHALPSISSDIVVVKNGEIVAEVGADHLVEAPPWKPSKINTVAKHEDLRFCFSEPMLIFKRVSDVFNGVLD